MKKLLAWTLTLAFLLALAGCKTGEEETGENRDPGSALSGGQDASVESVQPESNIQPENMQSGNTQTRMAEGFVARMGGGAFQTAVELSADDAAMIAQLLNKTNWNTEGTADCANDCILTVNGESVYYHSDCGTFNDTIQERRLSLTEDERAAVNAVLANYITLGFEEIIDETWGLTLSLRDATPTGLTLVFTQSGGAPTGELMTGSPYWLERNKDGVWEAVPELPLEDGVERAWTGEAYSIPENGSLEQKVNWEHLYGVLPAGTYHVGKEIMDFRGTGDYDERNYYAEFTIA